MTSASKERIDGSGATVTAVGSLPLERGKREAADGVGGCIYAPSLC